MKNIMFLFTHILFLTISTKSFSSPIEEGSYKCTGEYIDFSAAAVIAEPYWETVVVDGDSIDVPKFGNYQYITKENEDNWWGIPGKDTRYSFVKITSLKNTETKQFIVSIQGTGANPVQVQGQCNFKTNNWN